MALNALAKGKSGEREFCKWLEANFTLPVQAQRNLEQWRTGGTDVIVEPFAFEVKRRESLDLLSWWIQSKSAADKLNLEPIVAFRQNRKPWEFLISAKHIGCGMGFVRLDERTFKIWCQGVWEKQ